MSDETTAPAMTPQQQKLTDQGQSAFQLYREIAVGEDSLLSLVWYEFCTLICSNLPGLLGFGARSLLYPGLFKRCGAKVAFGRNVVLRNPSKIKLGKRVLIDDSAVLDARGREAGIELSDFVSIGRFTTIAAKGGPVALGAGVNIGSYCRLATQSRIEIGESTLVAAYAYIGPGNHQKGDGNTPLIARAMDIKGGVKVGAHCWIGARATILDGVTIGEGAIVGAHSLVLEDVPPYAVVAGTPARIVGQARQQHSGERPAEKAQASGQNSDLTEKSKQSGTI